MAALLTARLIGCLALSMAVALAPGARADEPSFCGELPTRSGGSLSVGRPAHGRLEGAQTLPSTGAVRLLPLRHARRCLNWGTGRLVSALVRAGELVRQRLPGSPPLGVGDLSKARGGPIFPYSRSHQSGRDADLAFYATDEQGRAVALDDLTAFDSSGRAPGRGLRFDAHRTWLLVEALLEDPGIDVQWLFISRPLRAALLTEAQQEGVPRPLLERAAHVLHQPSDAPPHADHLHLRVACTPAERALGCAS